MSAKDVGRLGGSPRKMLAGWPLGKLLGPALAGPKIFRRLLATGGEQRSQQVPEPCLSGFQSEMHALLQGA